LLGEFFGLSVTGQTDGGRELRELRVLLGQLEAGFFGGVAVVFFGFDGGDFFRFFDAGGVVLGAEGEAGVVAGFLGGADLAVEAAEEVDHAGEVVEVGFGVIAAGEFLEEGLGEPGGGGLKADFGEFRGIIAAEEVEEAILVEAMVEYEFLFGLPFEIAASGPGGEVTFGDGEAGVVESGGDVFVGDGVPEHAVDHVALGSGEAGDAAVALSVMAEAGHGEWFGIDDCERLVEGWSRGDHGEVGGRLWVE
jgi:hypothetical protein